MSQKLIVNSVTRITEEGLKETLELKPGVNILQGPPNSGKTVWLNMIDYLMGDTSPIEDVLSNEDFQGKKLYEKYISASMNVSIGKKEFLIERKWTGQGSRGKIFINDIPILAQEFSDYILNELNIPMLHFPKGNPYTDRSWPSLSWRMMLRHIYRQENYWSDLADKQPESEQHAVLTQFLGIAGKLFSQQFGDIIDKRKKLIILEAEKNQFSLILDNFGKRMVNPNQDITFFTIENTQKSIDDLESNIQELLTARQNLICKTLSIVEKEEEFKESFIIEKTKIRNELINELTQLNETRIELFDRISKFKGIYLNVKNEINKLDRTKEAGNIFADLKISHCPACDQAISQIKKSDNEICFLCHQPDPIKPLENRVDYEISQLKAEKVELMELIQSLENEVSKLENNENKLKNDLTLIERDLAPLRNKFSALISPEISQLDTERGRLEEMIENYKRLLKNLDYKNDLSKRIDSANAEISKLESEINTQESEINYEEVSDIFEDEIANYLNQLNKNNPDRWPHKRIKFRIGEKGFILKVNEGKWSKTIGATSKLYFLFAYHYALLALSKIDYCNYPGLLILDFPPELPNPEKNVVFSENYVVEPFIELCNSSEIPMQVIITGNSFIGLEGVNTINIGNIWDNDQIISNSI